MQFPQTCEEAYHSSRNDVEDTSCLKDEEQGADHLLPDIDKHAFVTKWSATILCIGNKIDLGSFLLIGNGHITRVQQLMWPNGKPACSKNLNSPRHTHITYPT